MRIPIDRQSKTPLYQQVQDYLCKHILSGQLVAGTRLPATRKLAQDLEVSRITIQNAYANLESEGLIVNREGSGSYVATLIQPHTAVSQDTSHTWPLWQAAFSNALPDKTTPTSPKAKRPIISFTGVGDPNHFPLKDLQKSLRTILQQEGITALQYGEMGAGYYPLRETIAHILASQGIQTHPENVLITSGSQQALALVCHALLKPDDVIMVEKPTYNLALDLFRTLNLNIVGVPVDENGLCVAQLEPLIQQYHPKLLYTIPNFQNPSGMSMNGKRRRQLIALAERYNLPVLEDDFVGDLRYNGRSQPAIKALDSDGHVIYVGTFSKMLMPGLRVGYLVANGPAFNHLVQRKQVTDLTTSTLIQRALHDYVTVGRYQIHLRRSVRLYRKRRDTILKAIKQYLPYEVRVNPPQGGLFVWLRLPETISVQDLWPLAMEAGVTFAPGSWFFPETEDGIRNLRLNFAVQSPENIEEGIRRLGEGITLLLNKVV